MERWGVDVALVEGDLAIGDDTGDDAGACLAGADGADAAVAVGDLVDFRSHPCGGEEGVLAAIHGRAAGVGGLAGEGDLMALDAAGAEHGRQRLVEIEEDGALLDVELEVGGGVFLACGGLFHVFEIDAEFRERVGEGDAVLVGEAACLVHVEVSGKGGGSEQAFPEACAFLVRPIDDLDGDGRFAVVLVIDAAENLDAGHDVEAAIEPAAVRDGIDVTADDERFLGLAGEGEPEVSGCVCGFGHG